LACDVDAACHAGAVLGGQRVRDREQASAGPAGLRPRAGCRGAGRAGHRLRSLPVGHDYAARVRHLPPLHADPFDRLLLAKAQRRVGSGLKYEDLDIEDLTPCDFGQPRSRWNGPSARPPGWPSGCRVPSDRLCRYCLWWPCPAGSLSVPGAAGLPCSAARNWPAC
jgi:hypothetical protein